MRITLWLVALFSFSMTLIAAEPFVGTWKLNVEKSKLQGNDADLAGETMTITAAGPNAFRTAIDRVSKSGQTRHEEIDRTLDGKEHPATGVGLKQEGASEIVQQLDASTRKIIQKKYGKVVAGFTATVSADGKVMTNRRINGEILVFEKQ